MVIRWKEQVREYSKGAFTGKHKVAEKQAEQLSEALYNKFGKENVKNGRIAVHDIIEATVNFLEYYNNDRIQEDLGWLSPVQFSKVNQLGTLPVLYRGEDLTEPLGRFNIGCNLEVIPDYEH